MDVPYDPEFLRIIQPMLAMEEPPPLAVGDIEGRQAMVNPLFRMMMSHQPPTPDIKQTTIHATAKDGHQIPILAFEHTTITSSSPGPALLFLHAGGLILGSAADFAPQAANLAAATGRPVYSIEYRLAPSKHPYPVPLHDALAAFEYLQHNASELNIDPARIGLYGLSAGGNLAAGLALLTRDQRVSPPPAACMLLYPMLDDRTVQAVPAGIADKLRWKVGDNQTGWGAYLGDKYGTDGVDSYAAPARATDLSNLPPVYIDIGGLDLFTDEAMAFAQRLLRAGNRVELHVFPGVFHSWELVAPGIEASLLAAEARIKAATRF
ncbi:arylesterase/monooxygenase [Myriangium duriaei CBS 260.36]|uniref:Arylesterase/monooxygenase n=1 Tax=Myriangium duriaei CBS 260.36 TaxID=1168546 RepID=A0A9P4IVX3_9PEZI|nr:arylesterase/monooxygenase [Myriangium duriaei CBS 260.36]